ARPASVSSRPQIVRAALAAQTAGSGRPARPGFAPGAATGPVPRRVQALLAGPPRPLRAHRATAALLAACAALSCAASATATADVHHRVEIAQGETGR
ncbi:M56 family peptidase, partial [Streptomyces eurythermus]